MVARAGVARVAAALASCAILQLVAADGYWRITEDAILHSDGKTLARLPGHLAYWLAWSGFFENAALGAN